MIDYKWHIDTLLEIRKQFVEQRWMVKNCTADELQKVIIDVEHYYEGQELDDEDRFYQSVIREILFLINADLDKTGLPEEKKLELRLFINPRLSLLNMSDMFDKLYEAYQREHPFEYANLPVLEKRWDEKRVDWSRRIQNEAFEALSALYCNPWNECDDILTKKEESIIGMRDSILDFDENLWFEVYTELWTDWEFANKTLNIKPAEQSEFKHLYEKLMKDRFQHSIEHFTSFSGTNYIIVNHCKLCIDVQDIIEFAYCLDYCKWRAGYLKLSENENKETENKLSIDEICYLIHHADLVDPNNSKQTNSNWAAVLSILTGNSYQNLRVRFPYNVNAVSKKKGRTDEAATQKIKEMFDKKKRKK